MDWYQVAQDDWTYYQDPARIAEYVKFNKITADQYQAITGQVYTAV